MEIVDGFVVVILALFCFHQGKCKHWTPLHQEASPGSLKMGWEMLRTMSAKAEEQILVLGFFPPSTWYAQQSQFFVPEWPSSRMAGKSGATKIMSKTWA